MIKVFYSNAFVDILIFIAVIVVIFSVEHGVHNIALGFISTVTIVRLVNHWNVAKKEGMENRRTRNMTMK